MFNKLNFNKDKSYTLIDLESVISIILYNKFNKVTLQLDGIECEYDTYQENIRLTQKNNKNYLGLISLKHYNLFIKEKTLILKSKN